MPVHPSIYLECFISKKRYEADCLRKYIAHNELYKQLLQFIKLQLRNFVLKAIVDFIFLGISAASSIIGRNDNKKIIVHILKAITKQVI